jgi:CheY-specific phosphatase CheX
MYARNNKVELEGHARLISEVVGRLLKERAGMAFAKQKKFICKPIPEFNERMKADGDEKFENLCYVSYINFYRDNKDMHKHRTLGSLIIYIEADYAPILLRKLQYVFPNEDSDEETRDYAGTLCNLIAGMFKTVLAEKGYREIEMSPFTTYKRRVFYGVDFCYEEYDMYEIEFEVEEQRRLVIELSIGKIPPK